MHEVLIRSAISATEVPDLRASVGWDRRDADYPTLFERCVTWACCRDSSQRLSAFAYLTGTGLEHGYIEDVMVHPMYQRQGLGAALVKRLLDDACARSISIVTVTYDRRHESFYARCGFKPCAGGLWTASLEGR